MNNSKGKEITLQGKDVGGILSQVMDVVFSSHMKPAVYGHKQVYQKAHNVCEALCSYLKDVKWPALTEEERRILGFRTWGTKSTPAGVVPPYIFYLLPYGTVLRSCITGKLVVKTPELKAEVKNGATEYELLLTSELDSVSMRNTRDLNLDSGLQVEPKANAQESVKSEQVEEHQSEVKSPDHQDQDDENGGLYVVNGITWDKDRTVII